MAGLIPAGRVVDASRDIFPTTGAHLDVRVIPQFGPQKGKKIDPRTAKTILQNVLIGKNQTPLVEQKGQNWNWNFPITSEYGRRTAPTAGASTFHQGIDVSLGAGTPLAYRGYGTYRPDAGFGSLQTTDPQGNPYEIRFLHTEPGAKASVGSSDLPAAPQLPGDNTQQNEERNNKLMESLFGKRQSMKDVLIAGALQQAMQGRQQSMLDTLKPYSSMGITPEQAMQLFA
jgi:hypothetical protein